MNTSTTLRLAALVAAAGLTLTACAGTSTGTTPTHTPPAASQDAAEASTVVTVTDAWFKAAEEGMSGAFGVFNNAGIDPVTIVSASSEVAHMVELHETAENASGELEMREVTSGFTIPAGGSFALEPGANHLMFMGLMEPLRAGATVAVTVTLDDGSTLTFEAPVKDYAGANENYGSDE